MRGARPWECTQGGAKERVPAGMSGVRLWLCIGAVGLAGFGLVESGLHAHGDLHHQRMHVHRHGDVAHTHHNAHNTDDGLMLLSDGGAVPWPCGDERHCCMNHGVPDAIHFTHFTLGGTRRLSELNPVATNFDVCTGVLFLPEAMMPPRAPPDGPSSQDALPHLRMIVLLI